MDKEIEKQIIERANKIALEKAINIVREQHSKNTNCMDKIPILSVKKEILSIKNDIMDGVKLCMTLIEEYN